MNKPYLQIIPKYLVLVNTLIFLTVCPIFGQIVNEGTLVIKPGINVFFGDHFTNTATGVFYNNGSLHLQANFENDGIVTSTDGVTLFDSTIHDSQLLSGDAGTVQFYNLVINNTLPGVKGLSVADGFGLEVTHRVILESGKLRLMGNSQLVQTHSGEDDNSGYSSLLVDQQGAKNAYRYNYWSAPVHTIGETKYQVQDILKDGTSPDRYAPPAIGLIATPNGTDATDPVQISTRWLYKYINAPLNGGNGVGWISLFDLNTLNPSAENSLYPAEGYIMKGTNATAVYADQQNYSFEGTPNNGLYTITLLDDAEYLVGNPYPSALDADAFINDNSINFDGTIYFWEHWSTNTHVYVAYGGGYAAYNLTGGVVAPLHPNFSSGTGSGSIIPKPYIPIGQGFLIRSETTDGGNIIFQNSQRVFEKEGSQSVFFKTATSTTSTIQARIRLDYTAPDGADRSLLFAFSNGTATDQFDRGYDGKMIEVLPNDLYFTMEDNGRHDPYAIQGAGVFDENKSYPLVLVAGQSGNHSIALNSTENFDMPIYILDVLTLTTHDLTTDDFVINLDAGTYTNRFKLVFKPYDALDINPTGEENFHVYFAHDAIILENPNLKDITSLEVFNTLGQLVYRTDEPEQLQNEVVNIPFQQAQATYFIRITSEVGLNATKIINY